MKKIYFLLLMLCIGQLYGQIVNQTIPNTLGANSAFRAPNGTTTHSTIRAHYMIYPADLTALPSGARITTVGFVYINGVDTAASGNLKFYMENSTATSNTKSIIWPTAITGMDTLFDGTYNIPVSATAVNSTIPLNDTFTYTGSGIHIAYDYLGANFSNTAALYDCNNTVAGDVKLIFTPTSTPGDTLNATSNWRPGIYIGYINPFTNDLAVELVFLDEGRHNKIMDTTQTIVGTIKNNSIGALTSVPVTLNIAGANPYSSTQTIASIASGASQTVTFSNLSAATSGMQSVKLSVPADQFTSNDSVVVVQSVNCDSLSWVDNSAPYTAIGFNTGSGILAAKHTNTSSQNISIKSIFARIDANPNILGNQLQAVLVDTGGTIIDSSAVLLITTSRLDIKLNFPLTGNNIITAANPDYFIGIRQFANATVGYYPLSSHPPSIVPTDRYYSFDMDGSAQSVAYTTLGTLGIGALIEVERLNLTNSDANDSICPGESVLFTTTGASSSTYNFKSGTTSLQNSSSTTYSSSPTAATTISVEGMHNTCPVFSNTSTINVVTVNGTATKTDDSTAMASTTWATYQWIDCGTGLPVTGANSQTFVATVSGNYKVAVAIAGCSDTSSCINLIRSYAGIEENTNLSLSIFPSPASDILNVKSDNGNINSISILSLNGKVIYTELINNSKLTLDVSKLASGVYFLKVDSERGTEVKRFIKN